MTKPLVYIVDDAEEVRHALTLLLASVGLESRSYPGHEAFLADFDRDQPGCMLLDIRMPGLSGLDLQEQLREEGVLTPVIIVSGHGDIPMAVRAVKNGAVDYIEKPFNDQALLDSVHRALEIDAERRGTAVRIAEIRDRYGRLTPREKDVLRLVAEGKRNKVIAAELAVTQSTIEAHRAHIMEKMGAASLSELLRMVISMEMHAG